MSEFILILAWLALMAFLFSFLNEKEHILLLGKRELRENYYCAILFFAPVIYMAATRPYAIGDTYAYDRLFREIPNTFRELQSYMSQVNKDKGFTVLSGIIKIIFGENVRTYFWILAIIQGISLIYVYRNYSSNYLISILLFVLSTDYISWMYNGVRQFVAVTLIFAATPLMLKKKWIPLLAVILLASTIHGSALLMLPIVFITQGNAWNKKTILFTLVCITALLFANQFTDILEVLLEDTQYTNVVSDWKDLNDDGTNILRVFVYSMPAILSIIGKKWIDYDNDPCINLCTNMSIVSAALYLVSAGTSGVYLGRLPIYVSLYGYILLPYLIERIFEEKSQKIIKVVMIGAYLLFYYYQIHFSWALI